MQCYYTFVCLIYLHRAHKGTFLFCVNSLNIYHSLSVRSTNVCKNCHQIWFSIMEYYKKNMFSSCCYLQFATTNTVLNYVFHKTYSIEKWVLRNSKYRIAGFCNYWEWRTAWSYQGTLGNIHKVCILYFVHFIMNNRHWVIYKHLLHIMSISICMSSNSAYKNQITYQYRWVMELRGWEQLLRTCDVKVGEEICICQVWPLGSSTVWIIIEHYSSSTFYHKLEPCILSRTEGKVLKLHVFAPNRKSGKVTTADGYVSGPSLQNKIVILHCLMKWSLV